MSLIACLGDAMVTSRAVIRREPWKIAVDEDEQRMDRHSGGIRGDERLANGGSLRDDAGDQRALVAPADQQVLGPWA